MKMFNIFDLVIIAYLKSINLLAGADLKENKW